MKLGQISIARAMCFTAIIALDLAWYREIMDAWRWRSAFGFAHAPGMDVNGRTFDLGLFGMFNVLAFSLLRMPSLSRDRRMFLLVFEAFGLISMVVYWSICWRWGAWLLPMPRSRHDWGIFRIAHLTSNVVRAVGIDPMQVVRKLGNNIFVTTVEIVVLTLPQLTIAVVGARLIRRVRRWRKAIANAADLKKSSDSVGSWDSPRSSR